MKYWTQRGDVVIEPAAMADCASMTALHAEAFPRGWSEEELSALLSQAAVFSFAARPVGKKKVKAMAGFVIARLAADEAEILSICVRRPWRRYGVGRDLMEAVLQHLHAERADRLFLEVEETNEPARRLYTRLGFNEVARRIAYYPSDSGQAASALVLRCDLEGGT